MRRGGYLKLHTGGKEHLIVRTIIENGHEIRSKYLWGGGGIKNRHDRFYQSTIKKSAKIGEGNVGGKM